MVKVLPIIAALFFLTVFVFGCWVGAAVLNLLAVRVFGSRAGVRILGRGAGLVAGVSGVYRVTPRVVRNGGRLSSSGYGGYSNQSV